MQWKYRKRIKIALAITAGILMFLAAAWWLLKFALGDSGPFLRDSWEYRALVPDATRNLPMDYCYEPTYYYRMQDGESPEKVTRRCHTCDPSTAMAHYRTLLLRKGYRPCDSDSIHDCFLGDDYVIMLSSSEPDRFYVKYYYICQVPCDYIPRKSYPLFRANEALRLLIGEVTEDSEASEQAGV